MAILGHHLKPPLQLSPISDKWAERESLISGSVHYPRSTLEIRLSLLRVFPKGGRTSPKYPHRKSGPFALPHPLFAANRISFMRFGKSLSPDVAPSSPISKST